VFEVRIHGRGGQGVVTAAELLSVAAFGEGKHAVAFPTFGSERTGAPVTSFCRIADRPIRSREPIVEPDALIVQDPTLLHQVDVFGGVGPEAYVLLNTERSLLELGIDELVGRFRPERLITVPATEIAREHLGRPLPNAALLGAFAALSGVVSVDSVAAAIRRRFSGTTGEGNVAAALAAARVVEEGRLARA
jgi:pyruvate ferredoxin oxidoreductase gamma subunit